MDHTYFSIAKCPMIPKAIMDKCTSIAHAADWEGAAISFAIEDKKLATPKNWFAIPAAPINQTIAAGKCSTLRMLRCPPLAISLDQTEKPNPVYLNLPGTKPEVDGISLDHKFYDLVSSNEDRMEVLAI